MITCALPPCHVCVSSLLCFPLKLCLTSPPVFHTPFYVSLSCSVYHPLMLLFMICFYDLSLFSPSYPLCVLQAKNSRLYMIHSDASISLVAGTVLACIYAHTQTHIEQPFLSRVYSVRWYAAPDTREEPEQAADILELQCCDVIRHGGYRQCLLTDSHVTLSCYPLMIDMNF